MRRSRRARLLAVLPLGVSLAAQPLVAAGAPGLPFSHDLETALRESASTGKPVVVAYVAAWCPVCGEMKRGAFRDPAVLSMAEGFLWVEVDIDRKLSTARDHDVLSVPQIHLVDPSGRTWETLEGLVAADDLRQRLDEWTVALQATPVVPVATEHTTHGPASALVYTPKGYRGLSICFSNVGYGPLRLDSRSAFQSLRLGIRPRTPSTLTRGLFDARATATWTNTWALENAVDAPDNGYFLDFEMLQLTGSLSYGLTDTLEIQGEFMTQSRFGGVMDGFIQGFHDLFGIEQSGRDEVPGGLFRWDVDPMDGRTPVALGPSHRGTFANALQVSVQHNVTCGTARIPAFAYSVTARATDSDDLTGGSSIDYGVSASLAKRFGRIYLYGTFGYTWFGESDFFGLELQGRQATFQVAVEWRLRPRHAILWQFLSSEGLLDDFPPFSDFSNEATLGWKWEATDRGVLEIGIVENIVSFDNSPDFGLHVGFSQRFSGRR